MVNEKEIHLLECYMEKLREVKKQILELYSIVESMDKGSSLAHQLKSLTDVLWSVYSHTYFTINDLKKLYDFLDTAPPFAPVIKND